MKAFIMAAGHGTRLKPLTDSRPKCLLPICGVPILGIWLDWCRLYGITHVHINTHAYAVAVREYLTSKDFGVHITISFEPELLGSAGTIQQNRAFIGGESEFAVLYADVLTNCDFSKMLAFHRERCAMTTIGVYPALEPRQCGIVTADDRGLVSEFVEKPQQPKSNLAFAGLMIAGAALIDELGDSIPADIGFDVLPRLVGRMWAYPFTEYLMDIGTMKKYEAAQVQWPGLCAGPTVGVINA